MPLPFFDDFNRANENPIAAPWVNDVGSDANAWRLLSNQLHCEPTVSPAFVSVNTTAAGHDPVLNVRVQCVVPTVSGFDGGPGGRSTTGSESGYYLDCWNGGNNWDIYRYPGNTNVGSAGSNPISNGDTIGIEIEGTNPVTIRVLKNGGVWGGPINDSSGARITTPGQGSALGWEVQRYDDFLVEDLDAPGPGGRIMGKLAGVGALAAEGGLAGVSGGLAG